MVARAEGYYRTDFRGDRGVTQGDPLSPTILNVVVDAVVRHWVKGVIEKVYAQGEIIQEGGASGSIILCQRRHGHLVGPRLDPGHI